MGAWVPCASMPQRRNRSRAFPQRDKTNGTEQTQLPIIAELTYKSSELLPINRASNLLASHPGPLTTMVANMDLIIPDFQRVDGLSDIQDRLIASARTIMLHHELAIDHQRFEITALELYLKLHMTPDIWFDRATDRDDTAKEQFNRGTWYVRQKKGAAYWRIDISAGNIEQRIQAGILIRQLDMDGGPATALHRIIRGVFGRHPWNELELDLISRIHGKRVDGSDGSPLTLRPKCDPISRQLALGPRINLPQSLDRNREGNLIRGALLRVAIWRRYSADKPLPETT
jgi:hypothetical protein